MVLVSKGNSPGVHAELMWLCDSSMICVIKHIVQVLGEKGV